MSNDGGPAFPGGLYESQHGGTNDREPMNEGMSLRQYAAIHLKVADSGIGWLDEMIARSEGAADCPDGIHPDFETVRYRGGIYERKGGGPSNGRYVPDGHGIPGGWWLYEVTSVDEVGPFDRLYRSKPEAARSTPVSDVAELKAEVEQKTRDLDAGRELMRQVWREMNAVRAAIGAPEGLNEEIWSSLVDCLQDLLADEAKPWMSGAAKALISPVEAEADRLRVALNKIAAWDEGAEANGTFDEPFAASRARAALSGGAK